MRLYWRDGLANLFVPAFLVPFIGFVINGSMPMIGDTRAWQAPGSPTKSWPMPLGWRVTVAPLAAGLIMMWGIAILHDLGHLGATAVRR